MSHTQEADAESSLSLYGSGNHCAPSQTQYSNPAASVIQRPRLARGADGVGMKLILDGDEHFVHRNLAHAVLTTGPAKHQPRIRAQAECGKSVAQRWSPHRYRGSSW